MRNVEYEDVLHLYRGWRRSESALKDKNKELAQLKARITQLQESHVKFRNQIQSLDSVKDLTVTLQNQLSILQQDNKQLADENKELAQLNIRADELLREKESQEESQTKMLRDVQIDFATLRGRYEETTKAHRELERLASDEQALRLAAESRFHESEEITNALREENRTLRHQLDAAGMRLNQCDQELLHASEQLTNFSREVSVMNVARTDLSTKEAEFALAKGDISRLLHLLEHSPATSGFIAHWQDSGGMDFVGIDRDVSGVSRMNSSNSHHHMHEDGDALASESIGEDYGHHRRASNTSSNELGAHRNQTFSNITNESTIMNSFDLSPAEFAHLKRIHGGDPFPMTTNMAVIAIIYVC